MMERNNEKINTLRKGIKRLTNELDEQWKALEHFSGDLYEIKRVEYLAELKTIKILGGFFFVMITASIQFPLWGLMANDVKYAKVDRIRVIMKLLEKA